MQATKVGIREFRAGMASYLEANQPLAITRHGETIGIFVPTPAGSEAAALRAASKALREMMSASAEAAGKKASAAKKGKR